MHDNEKVSRINNQSTAFSHTPVQIPPHDKRYIMHHRVCRRHVATRRDIYLPIRYINYIGGGRTAFSEHNALPHLREKKQKRKASLQGFCLRFSTRVSTAELCFIFRILRKTKEDLRIQKRVLLVTTLENGLK